MNPDRFPSYLENTDGRVVFLFFIITITYEFPVVGSFLSILLIVHFLSCLQTYSFSKEEEGKDDLSSFWWNDESSRPKASNSLLSLFPFSSVVEPEAYSMKKV
jgi:hypothetical protein